METKEESDRKFNMLLNVIDGLAKRMDDIFIAMKAERHTFQRHENQLDNHNNELKH